MTTPTAKSVAPTDVGGYIDLMFENGADVVFTTSFGYLVSTVKEEKRPNLKGLEDVAYGYILSTKRRKDNLAEKLPVKSVPGRCGSRDPLGEGKEIHTSSERGEEK